MPRLTRRKFGMLGLSAGLTLVRPTLGNADEAPAVDSIPFLRGVNFNGLTHEPGSQAPATPAVDYYLRQKSMNVVRLCLSWEFVQPTLNAPLDPECLPVIEDQIDRIGAAGAYVILEFHNYGRRSVGGETHVIGETGMVTSAHFADVWTRMALEWKDNPKVIFSLMNEPHDQDVGVLVDVSNSAIAAIRATGARNLIMVSGTGWNSMGWQPGSDNQVRMLDIRDPLDHFCFDVHHYFDEWSQGQSPNVRDEPIASMQAFLAWAKANRRRGFCGEFGCSVNRRGLEACRALLRLIEDNRDVFYGWAWWGAGGPWQPDYVFLLDPFASVTSPVNPDPEGSITWENPVDRPQMKLLQEFLPAATPFNGWLIEDALGDSLEALYRHGDFQPSTSAWIDSGPRGNDAEPGRQGHPAQEKDGGVSFAPTGTYLVSSVSSGKRSESVYAFARMTSAGAADGRTILGAEAKGGRLLQLTRDGGIRLGQADETSAPTANEVVPADAMALVEAHFAIADAAGGNGRTELAFDTQVMRRNPAGPDRFRDGRSIIGARDEGGAEGLAGTLHDLAIFDTILSADDNARVQGRLYWDKGMAHLLPGDHPYRIRAPERI